MSRLMTDWQVREASVEDVRYLTEICEDDSGSRASTPELKSQPEALFVVQVWGGLNDCAVPRLSIDGENSSRSPLLGISSFRKFLKNRSSSKIFMAARL